MTVENQNSLFLRVYNFKRRGDLDSRWPFDVGELTSKAEALLTLVGFVEDTSKGDYVVTRTPKYEIQTEDGQVFNASIFKNMGGVYLDFEFEGMKSHLNLQSDIFGQPWEDVYAAFEIIEDIERQLSEASE